ncbi:hypothetical protein E3N88_41241 [Mikania micrantha]|uniref:Uncharacterized protein n=1 Tax=Mikania micrantha TaxID=192012 RepID=A0A5N6LQ04_9ASTR|nr:hypothetical protein E3N88_41241 [Mikania micrantha]
MASIDPSLLSNPNEPKWAVEISKMLNHQLKTDIETPSVSVFQVPDTMTTKNPETYEPQQIGLGPIHHFQPRTYKKMEQKKLDVMRKILKDNDIKDYELTILNNVKKVVPIVRSCYDMFLEHDDEHLTWVFAIDGLFLLNIFHNYNQPELPKVGPKKRLVAQDVLMVENQIPFMVLKEIDEVLHPSSGSSSSTSNNFSPSIFRIFCTIHSPLKLCSEGRAPFRVDHLLHYMYYSVVNNVSVVYRPCSGKLFLTFTNRCEVVQNFPKDETVHAYEQIISSLETFTQTKLIVPSASNLHDAGFIFHSLEHKGTKDTRVRRKKVYLPVVTLNKGSDVILKNLVAYEALTSNSNSFPLAEFMVLMCALVVNVDDVKSLKNVIKGDLPADEVVKLFTRMSGSIPDMKTTEKTQLQKTIDEINMDYNSRLSMKPYFFLKRLALWLLVGLKAIGGFVESSWKIVAFILSLLSALTLVAQAYCDVFGCDPSLLSNPKEQKWVDETSKILIHQLETDIKIPSVTLFQVPETMTTKKPETYEPQQIGLGPIHHFQPRTYKKMEQKKLDVMRKVLKDNDIKDYKLTILNNVKKVVPIVRSCYDMFLEHDNEHLTWVFAIDGLFLLNIFHNYNQPELTEVGLKERLVAQDVLMVENQIPFMVLKEIYDALHSSSASNLHAAGFKFHNLEEHEGILDTHVKEKEVYLPVVTLNKDSDVIIRNLVAYESLTSKSNRFPLARFMVLMCALVVNVNDVKSLDNIIKGDLPADEVVKLFTGISGSIPAMKTTETSYFQDTIDDINRVYNSRRRMKPYLLLKKLALWLLVALKAIGGFVESSWKIVAFILSFVSVLALTAQAYCEVFGCVALKAIGGFVESSWKIVAFILSLVSVLTLTAQAYCEVFGCGNTKQ